MIRCLSSFMNFRRMKFAFCVAVSMVLVSCLEDNAEITPSLENASQGLKSNSNSKGNSSGKFGDYNIQVNVDGKIWTYTITRNTGAKALSHFTINFQNCGSQSATIDNILWATVNGQPAIIANSEGNTGCYVSEVTPNFVKFDELPEASSYNIVFELKELMGNFVTSTGWLKAGTSCYVYPVVAPCCPLQ